MPQAPAHNDLHGATRVSQSSLIALNNTARQLRLRPGRVRAMHSGSHLSAFKGLGMELEEVRPYQPGDDLYSIDWRVTARTGQAHTKVFREERERPVLIWVDFRHAMFFGTRNCFKSVLAAHTAALLAWLTVQHGDRVGGIVFADQRHDEIRPLRGNKGALRLIHTLSRHPAWDPPPAPATAAPGSETLCAALQRLQQLSRPGSLLFLISDFYDFDEPAAQALTAACHQRDAVMLHVSDPMERRLPDKGYLHFSDGQTEIGIHAFNPQVQQRFQRQFEQRRQWLKNLCEQRRLHYQSLSTDDDWPACLHPFTGSKV